MPTCADLISEASAQLHGWGSTQDRITPLTNTITSIDTSFTVAFALARLSVSRLASSRLIPSSCT